VPKLFANAPVGPAVQDRQMPSLRRPRRFRQKGGAIIETALLMPALLLMACGVMDLARVFYAGVVVESAARAGVQIASFSVGKAGALGETNTAALADAAGQGISIPPENVSSRTFCGCNDGTAEVSCSTGTCTVNGVSRSPSGYVETTVNYTYRTTLPYPGIPSSIALSGRARFRAQ
jgi:Flp pilus assembly protein TadG